MKYLTTLILLYAAAVQSCQNIHAAERLSHKSEIVASSEGLKLTIKIEAKDFETLKQARETILSKITALNAPINDEQDSAQGETGGFQWVSQGFKWQGGEP